MGDSVEGMGERRVRTKASRVSVSRTCLLTITIYVAASFARAAERLTVEHAIGVVSAAVKWAIPKTSARTWSKRGGRRKGRGSFRTVGLLELTITVQLTSTMAPPHQVSSLAIPRSRQRAAVDRDRPHHEGLRTGPPLTVTEPPPRRKLTTEEELKKTAAERVENADKAKKAERPLTANQASKAAMKEYHKSVQATQNNGTPAPPRMLPAPVWKRNFINSMGT